MYIEAFEPHKIHVKDVFSWLILGGPVFLSLSNSSTIIIFTILQSSQQDG